MYAFPYLSPPEADSAGAYWFRYDIWIVEEQRWSGKLSRPKAEELCLAQGMTEKDTLRKLQYARRRVKRMLREDTWRGEVHVFVRREDDEP